MIRGRAVIELYDKDTNELIYTQESSNIITNAYKNLLKTNIPLDIGFSNSYKLQLKTLTPLIDKVFGGVLLFSEQKNEDADNFMLTKNDYIEDNFLGNSGGLYSGDSTTRGTLNTGESGWNEERKEYTLTWDWPSHAANGKCQCICLTSRHIGNIGLINKDTKNTSYLINYGQDLGAENTKMYNNAEGVHHFHSHKVTDSSTETGYGYYIYSKNYQTNIYCKKVDNKYQFIEVTKKMTLGLTEDILDTYPSNKRFNDTNLYKYSKIFEVDYTNDGVTLPNAKYLQYYGGNFYFVTYTMETGTKGSIHFKVYKIDAGSYTKTDVREFDIEVAQLAGHTLYPRYIGEKIYFTALDDYLYILDLFNGTWINSKINKDDTSMKFEAIKFYDTVALIPMNESPINIPIYILNGNNKLVKNNLYWGRDNEDYSCFGKINTDDTCLKYPLANASSLYYSSSTNLLEYESQIILPFVSSINNVQEFVKNSSNVLKLRYILSEF